MIDTFGSCAFKANLKINIDKTMVSAIIAHGRLQKVTIGSPKIKYKNNLLSTMDVNTVIKYLGISFNIYGIIKSYLVMELDNMLDKLKKSYLKPQQRL